MRPRAGVQPDRADPGVRHVPLGVASTRLAVGSGTGIVRSCPWLNVAAPLRVEGEGLAAPRRAPAAVDVRHDR